MKTRLTSWFAALALAALAGCATTAPPAAPSAEPAAASASGVSEDPLLFPRTDPWERWNRKVYAFNDAIDTAVIRPVATAYTKVVPQPVRTGVTNFYGNFADLWSAVNNLLQGKLKGSAQDLARVSTNTLIGLGGLFDVATPLGIDAQREDFGQTLGYWGVPAGPYVVWPFLGPSTVRDSVAMPLDRSVGPGLAFSDDPTRYSLLLLGLVNQRANLLPASRMLDDMALDKYIFVRDAFLQRRRSEVYDGRDPSEDDEFEPDAEAVPASAPASAAPAAVPPLAASAPAPSASGAASSTTR